VNAYNVNRKLVAVVAAEATPAAMPAKASGPAPVRGTHYRNPAMRDALRRAGLA